MTDHAIDWIRQQKTLMPEKPFFVYYAPGATHAPHHVPTEWSDRYAGRFDAGWDQLREEIFARLLDLLGDPPQMTLQAGDASGSGGNVQRSDREAASGLLDSRTFF